MYRPEQVRLYQPSFYEWMQRGLYPCFFTRKRRSAIFSVLKPNLCWCSPLFPSAVDDITARIYQRKCRGSEPSSLLPTDSPVFKIISPKSLPSLKITCLRTKILLPYRFIPLSSGTLNFLTGFYLLNSTLIYAWFKLSIHFFFNSKILIASKIQNYEEYSGCTIIDRKNVPPATT